MDRNPMVCGVSLTVVEYSVRLQDEETRENVCLDQPSVKVICCDRHLSCVSERSTAPALLSIAFSISF